VAAVDEGVARGNERDELADRALDRLAGRQGDEDHALAREARAEGGEAFRAGDAGARGGGLPRRLVRIVAMHAHAGAREPPRHARAPAAQADDADLHALS